jgi:hypothetical protein
MIHGKSKEESILYLQEGHTCEHFRLRVEAGAIA